MRGVTRDASFRLYRDVDVDERTPLLNVALIADLVLRRRGPELLGQETSVLVVTIRALHQTFVHPVAVRTAELRARFRVAGVAKRRRLFPKQCLLHLRRMHRVATRTSNTVGQV